VDSAPGKSKWAEILKEGSDWRISIFACDDLHGNALDALTPPYVIAYAQNLGITDFVNCDRSSLIGSAKL
jgi:hypothetical protein